MAGNAYGAGRAIAERVKARDDYAGEYDGEVYLNQSQTHPRRPRLVPAATVMALHADGFDVDPEDPEVLAGFLAALQPPTYEPPPEEEPAEVTIPEGYVDILNW